MLIDVARFLRHLESFDMPVPRKIELLQTLWAMSQNFADRAFGVDAAQLALGISHGSRFPITADRIESGNTISPKFNDAAGKPVAGKKES